MTLGEHVLFGQGTLTWDAWTRAARSPRLERRTISGRDPTPLAFMERSKVHVAIYDLHARLLVDARERKVWFSARETLVLRSVEGTEIGAIKVRSIPPGVDLYLPGVKAPVAGTNTSDRSQGIIRDDSGRDLAIITCRRRTPIEQLLSRPVAWPGGTALFTTIPEHLRVLITAAALTIFGTRFPRLGGS